MFTLYLILFRSLTLMICFSLLGISSNKTSWIAPYIFRLDALRISSLIFFRKIKKASKRSLLHFETF